MNKKTKTGLIILALIISIINTKVYAETGKANQETVRMRKEATTNSSIVTLISLNEEIEILSEEGEWYKVKYKTYTGYIRKDMVTIDGKNEKTSSTNTVSQNVTSENTEAENTAVSNENQVNENTEVEDENNSQNQNGEEQNGTNNENQTNSENQLNSENQTNNENQINEETTKNQNDTDLQIGFSEKITEKIELRIVPSINSSIMHEIAENTQITVKDIINKWCYIETENGSGWTLKSKIKVNTENTTPVEKTENTENKTEEGKEGNKEEGKEESKENAAEKEEKNKVAEETKKTTEVTKYVSAETLNMRETADNNAKIVSQLKLNTKVTVTETTGTWSKIKVNGKTGYVASKYLSDKKTEVSSRSEDLTRAESAKQEQSNVNEQKSSETAKTSEKTEESTKSSTTASASSSAKGSEIAMFAKKFIGKKYVSGGSSPETGFDCSGFTSYVYKNFGISISRTSGAQASNGTAVSRSDLREGDLVIFNNSGNTAIGHVGIYIGGNTFIHAANSSKGVITTSLSDKYYLQRYVTARRIIN